MTVDDRETVDAFDALEFRLRTILPDTYTASEKRVESTPMRSAGLKFGPDGKVAWNEIWGSFCDLAMAGGPPHKGALLEPGDGEAIQAALTRYDEVVDEISRGVTLATELPADRSPVPGWVRVACYSETMAAWLLRAIVMENVAIEQHGRVLDLPASPAFRLEKEIKNVVTVIAKTCHYWMSHMSRTRKEDIAILFAAMDESAPLLRPADHASTGPEDSAARERVARAVTEATGLHSADRHYRGWLGLRCVDVPNAIALMRDLVASNVLARREESTLFVPVNPLNDPDGTRLAARLAQVRRLNARRAAS